MIQKPSQVWRIITVLVVAAAAICCCPAVGLTADNQLEISEFRLYATGSEEFLGETRFEWPEVEELNALTTISMAGFPREQKVDFYLVVFDNDREDDRGKPTVYYKDKAKHYLPAGTHDIVFPAIMRTDELMGRRSFTAEIEVSTTGVLPSRAEFSFVVIGPDPPEIDLVDLAIWHPLDDQRNQQFSPGDEFLVSALIEVEENVSNIKPNLVIYAMMEEDQFLVSPELDYQPYEEHWDVRSVELNDGLYEVRATGQLPVCFAEPFDFSHAFRVYVVVDFGPGVTASDYIRETLYDYDTGSHRQSDEMLDRLIHLDRGYQWEIRRVRGDRPETDRFWD